MLAALLMSLIIPCGVELFDDPTARIAVLGQPPQRAVFTCNAPTTPVLGLPACEADSSWNCAVRDQRLIFRLDANGVVGILRDIPVTEGIMRWHWVDGAFTPCIEGCTCLAGGVTNAN